MITLLEMFKSYDEKNNVKQKNGGERGIRTLDTLNHVYTLSRRAPSASRTSHHVNDVILLKNL